MLNRLLTVADGRGFVVQGKYQRFVITAAHCLPRLPEGFSIGFEEERTYPKLLGPIGQEPTVAAACVFVDPISDVAVLTVPDDQMMPDEASAFEGLVDGVDSFPIAEPFNPASLISLEGEPIPCKLQAINQVIWLSDVPGGVQGGMSGSPILGHDGAAVGVVVAGSNLESHGPNPNLFQCLPGWMLVELGLIEALFSFSRQQAEDEAA